MDKNEKIIAGIVGALAVVGVLVFAAVFGILFAFPIKWCWNYTMPVIFGLPVISWGQAWCLYFLSNMLIKSSNYSSKK